MLIFWKLILEEDKELYSEGAVSNATYIPSVTDQVVNYTLGLVFILCCLLSTILNPLLFLHHTRTHTKGGSTPFLFKSLAISDTLTCTVAPIIYAVAMMRKEIVSTGNNFGIEAARVFGCSAGCYSQCATTLLAATRFKKIITPFITIRKRWIVTYFFVYTSFMSANNLPTLLVRQINRADTTALFLLLCNVCLWVNVVHCIAGIGFSFSTVLYLRVRRYREGGESGERRKCHGEQGSRACTTILLMNVPYITSILLVILVHLKLWDVSIHDIVFGFMPILTSTLNPIILISRNESARVTIRLAAKRRFSAMAAVSKTTLHGHSST